ncbi:Hydroxypyruvate isomerase [Pseudonocardia dioxanivorans CB1190]|uniref:Hydroxypyruvate isomerase n=1 Tax=Pseudonocardia dioxanivorans (strain ATCC 55486 / DSM 44775 / JCM 13855 / CB1190) TaxID=675635 RepID=F4CLN7_PSEUX|nr:TIM barrel protein [Pseudonocardia dioxanivorans]AEA27090.1 Hydroxypyruvate isomerase [Pseudonocardia dioxanivorans CB1190]
MNAEERLPLVANISLLFAEVPYLERFARAAAAGFTAVETWWPWSDPVPPPGGVDTLVAALDDAGLRLAGCNLYGGDLPAGERGIACDPARTEEFAANLDAVVGIARRTGCPVFNGLFGRRRPDVPVSEQDALAVAQLATAARRLGEVGGTVLVEALGRGLNGTYPVTNAQEAVAVVDRVRETAGADSAGFLFDTFHLTTSGDDLPQVIADHVGVIAHVQVADAPGRAQPGTGVVDVPGVVDALWAAGYRGAVAAEYSPTVPTEQTFGWLDETPRLAALTPRA